MKKIIYVISFTLFLLGCATNEQSLTTLTGTITEITEVDHSTRILVEGDEESIIFMGVDEEDVQLDDHVTVTYDLDGGVDQSDPPQRGFESIEVH